MENSSRQCPRKLENILDLAKSKNMSDRRKFLQELYDVYDNEDYVNAINAETARDCNSSRSWNKIMLDVYRIALMAASQNSSGNVNTQSSCSSLLVQTVRLATRNAYTTLCCNDIITMLFEIWGTKMYRVYRDTYIKILVQYVLTNETLRLEITPDQWREILRLNMAMYAESSNESKSNLLDSLESVVRYGCLQSHLLLEVKKILPFLEEVFKDINNQDESMLKPLLKMTHTVCLQIATESRIALCEFSENSLAPIICLKACPEMYKMLLLFVKIHHPGGARRIENDGNNDGAYACDWKQWKNIVRGIYNKMSRDVKTEMLDPCFLELYCEVYRQMLGDPTYCAEASSSCVGTQQDELPRKFRRLNPVVEEPAEMLRMKNDLRDAWPYIQILTVLLRKYPNSLKSADYLSFLKNVEKNLEASLDNEKILGSLCELLTVLVENEKQHYNEANDDENVSTCWQQIWQTVLRASTMNKNEIPCHELLQSMMRNRDIPNPQAFLRLYLKRSIVWSSSSVETLLVFSSRSPIPDSDAGNSDFSIRSSLLQWALDIPIQKLSTHVPFVTLGKLLTRFAVKLRRFENNDVNTTKRNSVISENITEIELLDDRESKSSMDIERCNLTLLFRTNIFDDAEESERNNDEKLSSGRDYGWEIVEDTWKILVDALTVSLASRVTENNEIIVRLITMTIVARVISNFAEYDVDFEEKQMSKLVRAFTKTYKNILSTFVTINKSSLKSSSYLVAEAVEAIERFYCARYHDKVEKIIDESLTLEVVKFIDELVPAEKSEICKIDDSRDGTSTSTKFSNVCNVPCRVRNSADNIVTYFCCSRIGEKICEKRITILKNLMKTIDIHRCARNTCIRRAIRLLTACCLSDGPSRSNDLLDLLIVFVKELLKKRWKDEKIVRIALIVLPRLMNAAKSTRSTSCIDSLATILRKINKCLANEFYGPLVHAEFVKSLARVIDLNPALNWRINRVNETSEPMIQRLISYIENPFYVVRLEVVRALYVAMSSNQLDIRWKLDFLDEIIIAMKNLLTIGESSATVDELATRTIIVSHVIAAIIRGNDSRELHSRAIFAIINLAFVKNIKPMIIKRGLVLSVTKNRGNVDDWPRRLVEMNLHKLISHWIEFHHSFDDFPWILTNSVSTKDFLRRYIEILIIIRLQRLEFNEIIILCRYLDVSFVQTIEDYFATIISLITSMKISDNNEATFVYATSLHEKLRSNVEEFSNVKNFLDLLDEKLSDVVVDVFKRLNDQRHFATMFEENSSLTIFETRQPNFDKNNVENCLRSLEIDLSLKNQTLVEHLIVRRPWILQKILMALTINVHRVKSTDYEIQEFYRYAYFTTCVMEHLSKPCFDKMSLYIVRNVAHTLLNFIKDETSMSNLACSFFKKFINFSLPTRAKEIKEILSITVSSLIPIIKNGKVPRAIDLLRHLIIDNKSLLADAIERLDSFPNEETFEDIKRVHNGLKYIDDEHYTLEMEIKHFLNAIDEKTLSCSLEGLSHLNDQLSTRKNELDELYEKLEKIRGFAEDCATSTIHKFIYKLVKLTRSNDRDVSIEAAKCLGRLGPADLTTIVLHPGKGYVDEAHNDANSLTLNVINHLSEYLVDDDIDLNEASANALYEIFSTPWGSKFVDKSHLEDTYKHVYETNNCTLYDSIYPFVASSSSTSKKRLPRISIDANKLETLFERSHDLWITKNYETYSKWIVELTINILDCFVNFYAVALKEVCSRSIEFSEMILPRLVNLLIDTEKSLENKFSSCVDRFFGYVFEQTRRVDGSIQNFDSQGSSRNIVNENSVALSYRCIRSMLTIVKFMRMNSINANTNLTFDYLSIANAADYSSAYFTSLLYAELSCQSLIQNSSLLREKVSGRWTSAIDSICEFNPRTGKLLQHIVREAYLHIDDPDSIYGCGISHSIDASFRAQHYTHIREWDKVKLEQDMELNRSITAPRRDMLNALQKSGYEYLLGVVIDDATNRKTDNVESFMYEAAWRLGDWNLLGSNRTTGSVNHNFIISQDSDNDYFHGSHYRALAHLHEGNVAGIKNAVNNARTSIVQSLRKITLECSQTVYPLLSQLQMVQEIEEFVARFNKPEDYDKLFNEWNEKDFSDTHDFRYVEPILSQRLTMCQTGKSRSNVPVMVDRTLIHTHLMIAKVAEKQGYLSMASRVLDTLGEMLDLSDAARHRLIYRKASLAWKEGERNIGCYFLKDLIKSAFLDQSLRALALRICANWAAETKCEKPQTIINYYDESIKTISNVEVQSVKDIGTLSDVRSDLGKFAQAQYQQIISLKKSVRYGNLVKYSKNDGTEQPKTIEIISLENTDEACATYAHRERPNHDASELEDIERKKDMYLVLAIKNYLITLQSSNDHDLLIFRLVSLWFDNTLHNELNEILQENLPRVQSYKFIALLYQIAAHMSTEFNDFTVKIRDLMERCAQEHPHHTLPVLFALKNTYNDENFAETSRGSRKNSKTRPEPRVVAATTILGQLKNTNIGPIIHEISRLSHALVTLAYYKGKSNDDKKTGGPQNIPMDQPIMRIREFEHTIVPTITLDVSPTGNYDNIVSIREYVGTYGLPGGVNKPKKLICIGTDGNRRSEMVKGHDDLRQDAVMEQVFTVMNAMLKTSRETKRRRLHIRTYKIVPLSRRSGVMEWCDNTLPISNVLTDTGGKLGMHTKYYPKDWNTNLCKRKMSEVQSKSRDVKLATFLECCKNLHPAFHHFFTEKYPSPEKWFERRLAYVRSVATTSMVGYMLGLGDRHFSNILIDETTAEVIHIDFGIAFAQGKVLPIPETVPFRLTRDMEVAMGICGVEGVMRRSCEVTVAVLRERREILITVLQVLLYDPLFSWAITPLKTNDLTGYGNRFGRGLTDYQDEKKTNEIAGKALLRIDEKLQGTADGLSLSISGQVERLISQARDPANLCRLYCGWQPYL